MKTARTLAIGVVLALTVAGNTFAAAPDMETYTIDESFVPPTLSTTCGFDVTRHMFGTLTIRTYYDGSGNFVREVDAYKLTETLSANGITLTGRTVQQIFVTMLPDGAFTVAFVGSDFRLALRGAGISFGSVGRFVLAFDANGDFVGVAQDVGNVQGDFDAICAALTPA